MEPKENKAKVGRPKSRFYVLVPDVFRIQAQDWRHAFRIKEFEVNGDKKETLKKIKRYVKGNSFYHCQCYYGERIKL